MQCKSADTQRFGCDIKHCVESNRVSSMILVRFWNHFPRCKVIKVGIGRIPYQQQEFRRFNETSARRRQWLPENQNNNVQSEEHLLRHLRESKQHRGIKRGHITKAVSLANHRSVRTGGRQKPTHPLDQVAMTLRRNIYSRRPLNIGKETWQQTSECNGPLPTPVAFRVPCHQAAVTADGN